MRRKMKKSLTVLCEVLDPRIEFVWDCLSAITITEQKSHAVYDKNPLHTETRYYFSYDTKDEEFVQAALVLMERFSNIIKIRRHTL